MANKEEITLPSGLKYVELKEGNGAKVFRERVKRRRKDGAVQLLGSPFGNGSRRNGVG